MINETPFESIEHVQWYLGIDDEARGPLEMSEVVALFKNGQANGKTQAWTNGMETWVDAGTVEALKRLIGPPALSSREFSVMPNMSDMSTEKETNPSTTATITTPASESSDPVDAVALVASAEVVEFAEKHMESSVLRPDMSFEELVVAFGLSMKQVEDMVSNAVEIAGHTKTSLKLGAPHRFGLFQRF